MPVALWVWDAGVDRATLMKRIDDSDYVRELVSGEEDSVEAAITQLVVPVEDADKDVELPTSVEGAAQYVRREDNAWSPRVFVIADARTASGDGTVRVVELATRDELRVAPGSLLEVVRGPTTDAGGARRCGADDAARGTLCDSCSSARSAAATCTMQGSSVWAHVGAWATVSVHLE